MYVQDLGNPGASIYNDTMEALELTQHVLEPTHKLGNTLDVIYTESIETKYCTHLWEDMYQITK